MYMVLVIIATGAIGWATIHNFPVFGPFDYLNQLWYVFWHEAMHAIFVFLSGGKVDEMMVMHRLGGYVSPSGRISMLVFPAGYIAPVILSCFILYRSVKHPEQSDILAFVVGVVSMIVAGLFTTTDPVLRMISMGFVITNIVLFGLTRNKWQMIRLLFYVVVTVVVVTMYLQHVHNSNLDGANLTFLVGASMGGILAFTGGTAKVFPSLVVLSLVNSSLLYNSFTRATEMIPQVQAGGTNDPAILAGILGWNPIFMAGLWIAIIVLVCGLTVVAVVKVVNQSH